MWTREKKNTACQCSYAVADENSNKQEIKCNNKKMKWNAKKWCAQVVIMVVQNDMFCLDKKKKREPCRFERYGILIRIFFSLSSYIHIYAVGYFGWWDFASA